MSGLEGYQKDHHQNWCGASLGSKQGLLFPPTVGGQRKIAPPTQRRSGGEVFENCPPTRRRPGGEVFVCPPTGWGGRALGGHKILGGVEIFGLCPPTVGGQSGNSGLLPPHSGGAGTFLPPHTAKAWGANFSQNIPPQAVGGQRKFYCPPRPWGGIAVPGLRQSHAGRVFSTVKL